MAKYGSEGAPLHDPTVIAWLLHPGLFIGPRDQCRDRDRRATYTTGMTVADWWGVTGRPANAHFVGSIDAEGSTRC